MFSPLRQQIRLHSTKIKPRTEAKFPSLSSVTAKDVGYASDVNAFGHNKTYNLQRTRYNKLPIYTEYKHCDVVYTEIRKIQGDIVQLRNDIQQIIPDVKKDHFRVLMESKKILIKGNYKKELEQVFSEVF